MKLQEMMDNLRKPVDSSWISSKSIKGNKIDFISWVHYCQLLDGRVGLGCWSWEIRNCFSDSNRFYVVGCLSIFADDGTIAQMATGTELLNCSSYGDPSSNAEAMALRRCCAKLGLSRELWDKKGHIDRDYTVDNTKSTSTTKNYPQQVENNNPWLNLEGNDKMLDWIDKQYVENNLEGKQIVKQLRTRYKVSKKVAEAIENGIHREFKR